MTRTLLLATAAAAALIAAPAQAQTTGSDAGASWNTPHRSSASGLPTESPQVESIYNDNTYSGVGNRAVSGSSTTTTRSTTMGSGTVMDNTTTAPAGRVTTQSGQPGGTAGWSRSQTTTSSGSTGYSSSSTGSGSVMSRDDITTRRGRGQNDLELTQTSLLNEFSAQGYTAVRDFRKNGQNYMANVQDQQGRWMTVEIDPRTRAISPVR
ncbi:hypothetical protein [Azospirillum sp.]|uniref:hypothetical protein n=1 Tax=Azospirillum sp. TaxID=34012 RepID=UPI003D70AA54